MKPEFKLQIINLIATGKTNLDVAIALGCTIRTVQRAVQECRVETATQHAHVVEKTIQQYQVTESRRVRSLASSLRAVERELAKRSFADISTSQLLGIAFKLRHQVQKLEDRNEQRLEKAFKMHEQEFGTEDTNNETGCSEDHLSNQTSASAEPIPVEPSSTTTAQPATTTVQQPALSTNFAEPGGTAPTILADPKVTPLQQNNPLKPNGTENSKITESAHSREPLKQAA